MFCGDRLYERPSSRTAPAAASASAIPCCRVGQARGERGLLGFQRFDAAGQRLEFALFLVAELARGGAARRGRR